MSEHRNSSYPKRRNIIGFDKRTNCSLTQFCGSTFNGTVSSVLKFSEGDSECSVISESIDWPGSTTTCFPGEHKKMIPEMIEIIPA
jgi:hypothetical protein